MQDRRAPYLPPDDGQQKGRAVPVLVFAIIGAFVALHVIGFVLSLP